MPKELAAPSDIPFIRSMQDAVKDNINHSHSYYCTIIMTMITVFFHEDIFSPHLLSGRIMSSSVGKSAFIISRFAANDQQEQQNEIHNHQDRYPNL